LGIEDCRDPHYIRLAALMSWLEKENYVRKVDEEENPLSRPSPVRDITDHGRSFLRFARNGGMVNASKAEPR